MGERFIDHMRISRYEALFLIGVYLTGLYLRLEPRLGIDPHLLTFQGDIWYRLTMAQYILDNHALPHPDIRYLAYGYVPMWYPPLSPLLFALTSFMTGLDIPTVSSRIVPFIEALSPLSLYFLARYLYSERIAFIATISLALTPSFVFWTGISDPQSFTIFLIPLVIMAWVYHSRSPPDNLRLFGIGLILAVDFMMHLSYFILILVLLMVTISLVFTKDTENVAGRRLFFDLGKVVLISQILTFFWWGLIDSKTLYWWWINVLVTSSGMYSAGQQLVDYGIIPAVLGITAYLYITVRYVFSRNERGRMSRWNRRHLLVILWAVPLIIETQNEVILYAIGKIDLSWNTLAKPLEGFRFYCFLAQPFSIAIGVFLNDIIKKTERYLAALSPVPSLIPFLLVTLLLVSGIVWSIEEYGLSTRFKTSGLTVEEYEAALWFRDNSKEDDRIAADYYRAQMFAGVCGGKALLGGMFPLRNVDYPYIKVPGTVQNDLFILYNTSDPVTARDIARRYGVTHIFYSDNMIRYGNLLSYYKPAKDYGVDIDTGKFLDEEFFDIVYKKSSPYGDVVIVKVK